MEENFEDNLGDQLEAIVNSIDDDVIKNASNEELMGYLFLVEKMKKSIEKALK
jgi:hypothetical protein